LLTPPNLRPQSADVAAEDSEDDAPKRKKRKQRGEPSARTKKKSKKSKQGIFSKGGGSESDTVSERGCDDDSDDDDDDEAPVKEDPPLPASPGFCPRFPTLSHADTLWVVCVQEEVFYRVNEERFHLQWRAQVRSFCPGGFGRVFSRH
jgi:hypothetical protein